MPFFSLRNCSWFHHAHNSIYYDIHERQEHLSPPLVQLLLHSELRVRVLQRAPEKETELSILYLQTDQRMKICFPFLKPIKPKWF